jgi:hypothetical protein
MKTKEKWFTKPSSNPTFNAFIGPAAGLSNMIVVPLAQRISTIVTFIHWALPLFTYFWRIDEGILGGK